MSRYPVTAQFFGLVAWLGLCFAVAGVGALASIDAGDFYARLERPAWAPPATVFGPVWTTLFAMMGVAAWLVWRIHGIGGSRATLALFIVQLAMNALWSWLFFAWRLGAFALIDVVLLWAAIAATIVAFLRVSRVAGMLLVPYWLWVGFATLLNHAVWRDNPALLGY